MNFTDDFITYRIKKILKKLKNKDVVIFGAYSVGEKIFSLLNSNSINVIYFVDNNTSKFNTVYCGINVYDPQILLNQTKKDFVIVIACTSIDDVKNQLTRMGFIENVDIIAALENPTGIKLTEQTLTSFGFSIGKYSYGYEQFYYNGVRLNSIGSFCSIAPIVHIAPFQHPIGHITTNPIIYLKNRGFVDEDVIELRDGNNGNVTIKNDVWIGLNAIIMCGVTLGNGCIVGAGAVVTKDVPDYAVVAGVPARVIKYRFTKEQIKILNNSKWWEWSNKKIKQNLHLLTDNEKFFEYIVQQN